MFRAVASRLRFRSFSLRSLCDLAPSVPLTNIIGIPPLVLKDQFKELGLKETVERKVFHSIYFRGVTSFCDIPDSEIGKHAKQTLADNYMIEYGTISKEETSTQDGTSKWLVSYPPHKVETVYIPSDLCRLDEIEFPAKRKGGTICVSSQVGCTVGCTFCFTGTQKIARNLLPGEIVGQVMTAMKQKNEFALGHDRSIQSLVFMGQGEPFYNYSNVVKAVHLLADPSGLCFSKRKITLSTSGVVPMIERFIKDPELEPVQLAISLHAVRDSVRDSIVPLNKQWNIDQLMGVCRDYHQKRRILFEYVMLEGVNDSEEDAHELVRLIKGIRAVVNLIPFNTWPGAPHQCSSRAVIMKFHEIIQSAGINAPIRWPRGDDILAACGQLQTK